MSKIFIIATRNIRTIYIKVDGSIHNDLIETLFDFGFKIEKSTPQQWDYFIEDGLSYELDTEQELNQFIKNNVNYTKNRTHEI